MRILIFGADGQLGNQLIKSVNKQFIPLRRKDCDLSKLDLIAKVVDIHNPDIIINTAAYTNVDGAEDEIDLAYRINCEAPSILAKKAKDKNIPFIHFSTDYVFDGKKNKNYSEDDIKAPINIYGASKLEGENQIKKINGDYFIFRTSWLYSNYRDNFYLKIKKKIDLDQDIKVVNDQIGVPTPCSFVARQISQILMSLNEENKGIYHLVPNGFCSWFDFAKAIVIEEAEKYNLSRISPVLSRDYPSKAKRPLMSAMSNEKIKLIFSLKIYDWLEEYKIFSNKFVKNEN